MVEAAAADSGTFEFKAEVKQLLEILVHSVYTAKDIFIRELVSNAADALEKTRFAQVQGDEIFNPDLPLQISIECEERDGEKLLVISDTGIGMSQEELVQNIGTIAHSGASTFIEKLKEAKQDEGVSLIGRFGIGFYSVFMAAKKVVLTTRSANADEKPVVWTSDGLGSYTIDEASADTERGTRIEIFLREEEERFAVVDTIKDVIQRYSNYVPFPINVDGEQANSTTALWREQAHQVNEEQYNEFCKFISQDEEDPLMHLHFSAEVPLQLSALLCVPKTNSEIAGFGQKDVSLQLYVKRVLIDGENKDLLPAYLRFVNGVVESEDLPLNISRETLQENPYVIKIREVLTSKLLKEFMKMAKRNPEEYLTFWRTFGRILKEGYADFANLDKLRELVRFNTSGLDDEAGLCSLEDYASRMPEHQKDIYYLSGASREALERDPRLELFRKHNIEVLYLVDLADEFVLNGLGSYNEKSFTSADQVGPDEISGEESKEEDKDSEEDQAELNKGYEDLLAKVGEILGDRVLEVKLSKRLVGSPACLVGPGGVSGHMDKMFKLMNNDKTPPKRILELNPDHDLVKNLNILVETKDGSPFLGRAVEQIFDAALLMDGYLLDPHKLVQHMHETLAQAAEMTVEKK